MECRICGGLVEWETLRLTQTRCRRCDAVNSHVDDEEEVEAEISDGGPTDCDLGGEVAQG